MIEQVWSIVDIWLLVAVCTIIGIAIGSVTTAAYLTRQRRP